jgi:tRNA pseudouridine55 synthase
LSTRILHNIISIITECPEYFECEFGTEYKINMKIMKDHMKNILTLNKPPSLTPLQLIKQYQKDHPKYQNIKMTYAGRLDPMAEGLMLILANEECKQKQQYLNLDKEYILDILWGINTDTYDILGRIVKAAKIPLCCAPIVALAKWGEGGRPTAERFNNVTMKSNNGITPPSPKQLTDRCSLLIGKFPQPYPPYSSKTINGKPLWWYAKNNKLNQIKIPTKQITIHSIKHLKTYTLTSKQLQAEITNRINNLKGDFRQQEIINSWNQHFTNISNLKPPVSRLKSPISPCPSKTESEGRNLKSQVSPPPPKSQISQLAPRSLGEVGSPVSNLTVSTLQVSCSSGTYMRSLAHTLGKKLNTPALAYKIKRTKIGNHSLP